MNKYGFLHRVILGVRQKPLKTLTSIFIAYAAIWTVLEPLISIVLPVGKYFSGELKFFILVAVSSLIGLYKTAVHKDLSIKYGNALIKVVFGDLFSFDGIKAIPVSRYFFEVEVVPTSLQSKIIQFFVQSQEGSKGFDFYEQSLSSALEREPCQENYRSATQRNEKYYPLGSTAFLKLNGKDFVLFSLTETELIGYIPNDNCDISKMWASLEVFWPKIRVQSRGRSINIPLIGSGVTGIRLSPNRILELNLLAIINAIDEGGKITTEEIRIVLHPKYMETIILDDFQSLWR
jgi:Domain of unknown function (DUF6430)